MYKQFLVISLVVGLLSLPVRAQNLQEDDFLTNPPDFFIKLSIDNNIKSSQESATDVAFSAISLLGYANNHFELSDNIFARIGFGYATFLITLLNHEISGHGLRGIEFGGKIKDIKIRPFSGEARVSRPDPYHMQKEALISLGGNEVNYLLSQKLLSNVVVHNQQLDPVTAMGYIFSSGNQGFYAYIASPSMDGHDLKKYSRDMETMYGDKSMSLTKIRKFVWLDALDPVFWTSLYSAVTGRSTEIPMIEIYDVSFTPFARAILTPYGAIEPKLGMYIFTKYSPIRIGFSLGKQSKTTSGVTYTNSEKQEHKYLASDGVNLTKIGLFNGLGPKEDMRKHFTYSIDLSVFKLLTLGDFVIGFDAVLWSQPELFTPKPYFEKPKIGGMFVLNGSYQLADSFAVLARLGYKTSGFVPGHHIEKTPILSIGFEYKL